MSFFQNPFTADFHGNWVLADRKQILRFDCPRNNGRGDDLVVAWNEGPYDLSGNDVDGNSRDTLVIALSLDADLFKNWANLSIDITAGAAVASAVTAAEIVTALNNNEQFASFFVASLGKFPSGSFRVDIRQKHPVTRMRFYILNGRAEEAIKFNMRAGVAELPSYFERHSVTSRYAFNDSHNMLVILDESGWVSEGDSVDGDVIFHAVDEKGKSKGFDPSSPQDDYEFLDGRSGLFVFTKNTVDASNRITEQLEYHAGSDPGDMAIKRKYTYTGTNTNPDQVTEEPYVLVAADIITP